MQLGKIVAQEGMLMLNTVERYGPRSRLTTELAIMPTFRPPCFFSISQLQTDVMPILGYLGCRKLSSRNLAGGDLQSRLPD